MSRPRRRRPRGRQKPFQFTPAQLAARAAALPVVTYPDLPVSDHRDEIAAAIESHQVVIVSGETGSGKTTQLPKICLELGRGIAGMIGHTQPRRIAARAVAERIASELGGKLGRDVGDVVGYQVRFTDEVGPTTLVKLMTDGILLAELGHDPNLSRYDTIIVDEAHERSLNIDFIIGYLTRLLPKRPDLKVIITSATIDSKRFAEHFAQATGAEVPVIEVSGRAYPVEVRYRPLLADLAPPQKETSEEAGDEDDVAPLGTFLHPEQGGGELAELGYGLGEDLDLESALVHAVDELLSEPDGDILVFLPGERDIVEATAALKEHLGSRYVADTKRPHAPNGVEVIPLFARLSAAEQHRVYAPHHLRRIVLATNIAETSLTVPGIRYVIDGGLARVSRFSNKTKVQRLPIEAVSQASAGQRAGRAGRTSEGIAIRLYSERDFDARDRFTEPEILRTSLASVILQMKALGLGDVADFPFIDKPNPRAVRDGLALLTEIGALDPAGNITATGRKLARLPIDPRLGRMLLEADKRGTASEVLIIVAALSIQDVRERPSEFQAQADTAHARYTDPRSDFITYLNLWRYLNVSAREMSSSAFRRMCRREFFHYLRFREWRDIVRQLQQMAREVGIKTQPLSLPSPSAIRGFSREENPALTAVLEHGRGSKTVDVDEIHRSILPGLLSNLGHWDEPRREYVGARQTRFTIWPGSGLKRRRPDWVMAAELVETSRLFARTVAAIKPEWVEPLAKDLVTRSYSDPVWSRAKGAATVLEKVALYGLTLIADRQVLLTSLGDRPLGSQRGGAATLGATTLGARIPTPAALAAGPESALDLAREMFIQHALVEGDWRENYHAFVKHNQQVMEEAEALADRLRDPAAVPDEAARYRFFEQKIPATVTSAATFNRWWKGERPKNPSLLDYTLEELLPDRALADPSAFPSVWKQGDLEFEVGYSFEPGTQDDGITITIPLSTLPRVRDEGFDWLVPGLQEELCVAYIRALPKAKRRLLAPATQTGEQVWQLVTKDDGQVETPATEAASAASSEAGSEDDPYSLAASLDRLRAWGATSSNVNKKQPAKPAPKETGTAPKQRPQTKTGKKAGKPRFAESFRRAVSNLKGVQLDDSDLRAAASGLPPHLRVTFRVVDQEGNILGAHDSLPALQKQFSKKAGRAVHSAVKDALTRAREEAARESTPQAPKQPAASQRPAAKPAAVPEPVFTEVPLGASRLPEVALPRMVESTDAAGLRVRGYPALVPKEDAKGTGKEGAEVAVRPSLDEARRDHRQGLAALALQELQLPAGRITSRWTGREALMLAASPYKSTAVLALDAQRAALAALLQEEDARADLFAIRTDADYQQLRDRLRDQLEDRTYRVLQQALAAVEAYAEVEAAISKHAGASVKEVRDRVRDHAENLFTAGFLTGFSPDILAGMPRYLRADTLRLTKAARSEGDVRVDQRKQGELAAVEDSLQRAAARIGARPYSAAAAKELDHCRMLVEELRVSLFAESLGTAHRVSPTRLLRRIETLDQGGQ